MKPEAFKKQKEMVIKSINQQNSFHVVTVGVGSTNTMKLHEISSIPSYVLTVDSFDELGDILSDVGSSVCNIPQPDRTFFRLFS